jgi:hypothetical protein
VTTEKRATAVNTFLMAALLKSQMGETGWAIILRRQTPINTSIWSPVLGTQQCEDTHSPTRGYDSESQLGSDKLGPSQAVRLSFHLPKRRPRHLSKHSFSTIASRTPA